MVMWLLQNRKICFRKYIVDGTYFEDTIVLESQLKNQFFQGYRSCSVTESASSSLVGFG